MRRHLIITAVAFATAFASIEAAEAAQKEYGQNTIGRSETIWMDLSARRHRRSACDGFHRCRCGTTAARLHGLPYEFRGHNLKRAVEWKAAFKRIAEPALSAVVYQVGGGPSGHVSTITGLTGDRCRVTVTDDRGTYERNICRRSAVILSVNGG